ncbi:hypothetical protein COO59_03515 [Mixta theicola]|uniref:Uncharacterized protein n=1 Tax=Mixta theicola TaxID=1458355 RepID=A0A2K1QDA3_9GAMM|nr:hypothetical protein COO59_03515 [Mixta theicola]
MITIHLRFSGGSTEEEHDIAHIASSITCPRMRAFFCPFARKLPIRMAFSDFFYGCLQAQRC